MNIAIIISHPFDPNAGGVQRVTESISKIFTNYNHHVSIISFTSKDCNYLQSKRFFFQVSTDQELKEVLAKEVIDVIINQEGYSPKFTKIILRVKSPTTRIINNLHINPLNFYQNHYLFITTFLENKKISFINNYLLRKFILGYHILKQKTELRYIVKNTDAFVMLSERFIDELYFLAPGLKKYQSKLHGIGNPFQRPALVLSTLEKDNIVLFVGRLNILQKRVDLLLEIWKQLHIEHGDWEFWVCGEGEDQQYMEDFCLEHRLDRVSFFGKVNPNQYYRKAKLFHMTSAFEGFGNVLIEAQSYGCVPMLFDSYSAASDIISHQENGILIKPFDVNDYVKQTANLMRNPQKIAEFAKNGFDNVLRFSYQETYKKWEEVFASVLADEVKNENLSQ
ncbi:glycosyltransferase [Flavobacterium lacus]|uniref:Glycosyltransferase involved in cell wall biosynthesis n=1 Tax=Flavobacterium lacus TaxID=1353778 RepID=A0A328WV46_9FLAO|nr:glycosyltransferase [Flavobacterium lacus]RAR47238.1 glycosyltransferase involved in cell wall biosynthesis [Flavobacterium lacus]